MLKKRRPNLIYAPLDLVPDTVDSSIPVYWLVRIIETSTGRVMRARMTCGRYRTRREAHIKLFYREPTDNVQFYNMGRNRVKAHLILRAAATRMEVKHTTYQAPA